jgi:hypothetical protein
MERQVFDLEKIVRIWDFNELERNELPTKEQTILNFIDLFLRDNTSSLYLAFPREYKLELSLLKDVLMYLRRNFMILKQDDILSMRVPIEYSGEVGIVYTQIDLYADGVFFYNLETKERYGKTPISEVRKSV